MKITKIKETDFSVPTTLFTRKTRFSTLETRRGFEIITSHRLNGKSLFAINGKFKKHFSTCDLDLGEITIKIPRSEAAQILRAWRKA